MTLTKKQKERLAKADEIIQAAQTSSQQPRFANVNGQTFLALTTKWTKEVLEQAPVYSNNSMERDKWLAEFWPNEPYLAAVINSVVQIDRNRGWSLVGGRNQVLRFSNILHNYQVAPGKVGWRDGIGAASLAHKITDMGALVEIGRQFKDGPLAGFFHLDPTRCKLTGKPDAPLLYYPKAIGRSSPQNVPFGPNDYMRIDSMTSIDERFYGLGYCALSRAIELAIVMVAVWRHEQEMLFARAPKGLLLIQGITDAQWKEHMQGEEQELEGKELEWFNNVAVFASGGNVPIDAKLFTLSQLPQGFDQEKFTNLLMYGYANAFGYDAREFWPVSSGGMGTATETTTQHRKATDKGGREFWYGLQEQIQNNLPPTLRFEPDERDAEGELIDAQLQKAKQEAINLAYEVGTARSAGEPLITREEARELMAENGIIPREWTETEEEEEATDVQTTKKLCLEWPEVQQAINRFPEEPLIRSHWPDTRVQVLYPRASDAMPKIVSFPTVLPGGAFSQQKRFGGSGLLQLPQAQSVGNYPEIQSKYYSQIVELLVQCLTEETPIAQGRATMKKLAATSFVDAFETGWIETGGSPYEPDESDSAYLANRLDQELGFIDALFSAMRDMLNDTEEPLGLTDIDQYAEERANGYTRTLDTVYGQGKMRGKKSVMLTFDGPDGRPENVCQKNNGTCVKLKGQRHRARWWLAHELVPYPGNPNYNCGGYECQHFLKDDQGNRFAGPQE